MSPLRLLSSCLFSLSPSQGWVKRSLILFVLVLSFASVHAQIINIEDKRKDDQTDGINGQIDFNFKYTKNTQRIWELGNRSGFQYQKDRNRWLVLSDFRLIRSSQEDLINKGFGHFRYNYQLSDSSRFALESWLQGQYNEIQKIDRRILLGAGGRFKYDNNSNFEFHLGIGGMYEQEKGDLEQSQVFRGSSYVFLKWLVSSKVVFNSISYFQPRFNQVSDFRYANESTLTYELGEHLSIIISYNLLYDSMPSEGIPTVISELSNGIRFKF